MMAVDLEVNGVKHRLDVDPGRSLLDVLRNELHLTGTKYGCGEGQCAACTVLLDGRAVQACLTPVGGAAWKRVTTIEGLAAEGRLHPVQQAFLDQQALQCGYCTPGMIMTAVALVESSPPPDADRIRAAMNGNLCRCGTYPRIVEAVSQASRADQARQAGHARLPVQASRADQAGGTGPGGDALEVGGHEPREIELRGGDAPRREVLRVMGSGLVVVLTTRDVFAAPRSAGVARESGQAGAEPVDPEVIGAWLYIAGDGAVTGYTGKVEVGQGIRTSLAQELAEELRVPLERVALVMGDTDLTPWDMGTFGSMSTPQMGTRLRKLGAAARGVLLGLAAEQWGVDASGLEARGGSIHDPRGGRSLGYGELTAGRALTEIVRADVALTPAERWTVAGESVHRTTGRDVVTGRLRHTSDLRLPDMLLGKVLRAPTAGATLDTVDLSGARALEGVVAVHEDDFVGVAARSLPEAARALGAVRATWTRSPRPSQAELFDYLRDTRPKRPPRPGEFGGAVHFEEGDVALGMNAAEHRLSRTYTAAYIAHVPLETRAALARWDDDGKLTVWTGTQRPFGVQEQLATTLGLAPEKVRVIVPDTGSGYGGKHTGECAVEAARLARAAGVPVKVQWTREEEFRWAYFRPAGVMDVSAGIRANGALTAWEIDNYNAGAAGIRTLYTIPHQRIDFHVSEPPFRQGSYRALAATANHFAREMHLDELASLIDMDPLELRLRNLRDDRMTHVLRAAAERFGWGARAPAGHGYGIAGGFEKAGYVATCADVAVDAVGAVRVDRLVTAFDCGAIVNPDNLRNQIEGAQIQGLGGALFEEIDFDGGVVETDRLSLYRVPRFSDVPHLETIIVNRWDQPSAGAGETPLVALAPAVGAAIAAATGQRRRSLPMARHGVPAATS